MPFLRTKLYAFNYTDSFLALSTKVINLKTVETILSLLGKMFPIQFDSNIINPLLLHCFPYVFSKQVQEEGGGTLLW